MPLSRSLLKIECRDTHKKNAPTTAATNIKEMLPTIHHRTQADYSCASFVHEWRLLSLFVIHVCFVNTKSVGCLASFATHPTTVVAVNSPANCNSQPILICRPLFVCLSVCPSVCLSVFMSRTHFFKYVTFYLIFISR